MLKGPWCLLASERGGAAAARAGAQTGRAACDAVLSAVGLVRRVAETLGCFFSLLERSGQRIRLFCVSERICGVAGFKWRTGGMGRGETPAGEDEQAAGVAQTHL